MELPATEPSAEWLIDAANPLLTDERLARIADDRRPDRLAWNTFRTLALWNTDTWIPALLEVACGEGNRLSALEWGGAEVVPWGAGVPGEGVCDVALDGPEAYVVVVCTLVDDPITDEIPIRAGAVDALDGSLRPNREAGVIVVAPSAAGLGDELALAADVELRDGRLVADLLDGAMGALAWSDLARLALDLAEEGDPDVAPVEQVRQLVREMGPLAGNAAG